MSSRFRPRYAVYFASAKDSPLTAKGEAWLGYSAWTGEMLPEPALSISRERWNDATSTPRVYGFHATLKAPMRLKDGIGEEQFLAAVKAYCQRTDPVIIETATIEEVGPFLAIVPAAQSDEVSGFAAAIVREFEEYRAPLLAEEVEKRLKSGLSDRQEAYLKDWGYPYIFEEFRFHMTLSGRLPQEERTAIRAEAETWFGNLLPGPLPLDQLVVFKQNASGSPFHIIADFPLR